MPVVVSKFNYAKAIFYFWERDRAEINKKYFQLREKHFGGYLRLYKQDHSRGRKLPPQGNRPSASYPYFF